MQTECTQQTFEFQGLGRRAVVARFDGGPITSDAGGLLLREVEEHTDIIGQLARCFTDYREQEAIEHPVEQLPRQRIFGLALGYEDLNDHDDPRHDTMNIDHTTRWEARLRTRSTRIASLPTTSRGLSHAPVGPAVHNVPGLNRSLPESRDNGSR